MMTIVETLAQRIADFDPATVSDLAIARSAAAVVDTIGVALGGAGEPACRIEREIAADSPAPGRCLVLGTDIRTNPLRAAFLNGTAAHILDYDDGISIVGGHPSVMLVPPLVALAEDRGKSGRDVLVAYVVGLETMVSVARGVNLHHYEKGWHPTSTLGIFGVAGACAQLIGLDAERTAIALALCTSMASGVKINFGTMTKSLHVGQGARNGLHAVLLAERGFTASLAAMEGRQGFLDVYNGAGHYDAEAMTREWAAPYVIESVGVRMKQYPCCGSTHAAIAAAAKIHEAHAPNPDDIDTIEIQTHRRRLPHTDRPDPVSALAAKFSIQYVVARTLLQGDLGLADFEGEAHRDAAVRALMEKTTAGIDPALTDDAPDQFLSRVTVRMRDGAVHSVQSTRPDPTRERLLGKFADCARRVLPADRISVLVDAAENLHRLKAIGDLTRLMDTGDIAAPSAA